MNPNKALWEKGDFTRIAASMRESGEALVKSLGVKQGLSFAGSPTEFVAAFRNYYGPTMNAFDAAEKNKRAADLQAELDALFAAQNQSTSRTVTSIPATFLRVTVSV